MSFDYSLTLRDFESGRQYSVDVSFRESEAKTRAQEVDTVMLLCANARFGEGALRRALRDADNILHVMSIRASAGSEESLPDALSALARRNKWVDVGFTLFSSRAPWSLSYLSLRKEVMMFGLGKYLYLHYEAYVRARFADRCRYLYVAALLLPVASLPDDAIEERRANSAENNRIVEFYRLFDFRAVDVSPSPGFVFTFDDDIDAESGAPRTVSASEDTLLMRKPFMTPPLPAAAEVEGPVDRVVVESDMVVD